MNGLGRGRLFLAGAVGRLFERQSLGKKRSIGSFEGAQLFLAKSAPLEADEIQDQTNEPRSPWATQYGGTSRETIAPPPR